MFMVDLPTSLDEIIDLTISKTVLIKKEITISFFRLFL